MVLRLSKYLADCGIASRRKTEELILNGDVSVNGQKIIELGTKIDTNKDVVMYKNKIVHIDDEYIYIMLHKPEGYITTVKDQFDRPCVMELVKDIKHRLVPVGRLDYDTSGLLLLTNDGGLTYKLTHPKHNVEKVYICRVIGNPTEEELISFRTGLKIDNYITAPASVVVVKKDERYCSLKVAIKEGKNRQVRKMCEALGYRVAGLKRVATGKLFLGELKKGEYRYLTTEEIKYLKET